MFRYTLAFACVGLLACGSSSAAQTPPATAAPPTAAQPSKTRSADDGWFDLSGFLDTRYGFLPVGTIITEPAVGLGAGGGLAFMDAPLGGSKRPNVFVVGGFGTENGTKGGVVGDMRYWADGRIQTLVGAFYGSVNLDFYGLGDDSLLADNPLRYNLEPAGGVAQIKFRLGAHPIWAGLSYAYASTEVAFDAPAATPGLPDFRRTSKVGGFTPSFSVDSRDALFTPTRGHYIEGTVGVFDDSLGSDDDFLRAQIIAMQYAPLPGKLFLGFREQVAASTGGHAVLPASLRLDARRARHAVPGRGDGTARDRTPLAVLESPQPGGLRRRRYRVDGLRADPEPQVGRRRRRRVPLRTRA